MHDAERAVALLDRFHDHAVAENIGELLEADRLALHLAPDRIGPLVAAVDLGGDAAVGELALELLLDLGDQVLAALGERGQAFGDDLVGLGD